MVLLCKNNAEHSHRAPSRCLRQTTTAQGSLTSRKVEKCSVFGAADLAKPRLQHSPVCVFLALLMLSLLSVVS